MIKSKLKKQEKGFTIIEVLIVLAIAGLIILIVFLAVPALQRNSRNTQRRDTAARYLSGVNEFINNHQGTSPVTPADVTEINALVADGPISEPSAVSAPPQNGAFADTSASMQLVTKARCNGSNAVGGSSRQVALRYYVEDASNNPVAQCNDV